MHANRGRGYRHKEVRKTVKKITVIYQPRNIGRNIQKKKRKKIDSPKGIRYRKQVINKRWEVKRRTDTLKGRE